MNLFLVLLLVMFFANKINEFFITFIFWLLGWNDRRKAKKWKAEICKICYSAKSPGFDCMYCRPKKQFSSKKDYSDRCQHGTDFAFDCEDCQKQPKGW